MGLSKEEKKARKEAKKLEKIRLEMELKKKMRRDELTREMAAQAKKRGDLDKSWRDMMMRIKEPVFKQDIEIMWHVFERVCDKKDYLIKYVMKLVNVADDQFQRTIASFCDTLDTMIIKFLSDLKEMSKDYDQRMAALLTRGEDIAAKVMTDHNTAELHLQLLIYHGHKTADTYTWNARGENMVKEDEERSKYSDERENVRSFLENSYSSMWDEYKSVLRAYVVGTADNQKQVRRLRRKENLMADIIASQAKKIASNDEVLRRLRTELTAYESGTKQAVFRERRDRYRAACYRMKQCLLQGCATDTMRLATLVRAANDALEWIETAYKKAEKIQRLAALCRKFETRREKVLPFGSDIPHSPNQTKINVRRQTSDDSLVTNAISSTCGLTRLWQRIAKAELGKRALIREKSLLEHENAIITEKINAFNERKLTADTTKCLCNEPNEAGKKSTAYHPTAIEGVLELGKYTHIK